MSRSLPIPVKLFLAGTGGTLAILLISVSIVCSQGKTVTQKFWMRTLAASATTGLICAGAAHWWGLERAKQGGQSKLTLPYSEAVQGGAENLLQDSLAYLESSRQTALAKLQQARMENPEALEAAAQEFFEDEPEAFIEQVEQEFKLPSPRSVEPQGQGRILEFATEETEDVWQEPEQDEFNVLLQGIEFNPQN